MTPQDNQRLSSTDFNALCNQVRKLLNEHAYCENGGTEFDILPLAKWIEERYVLPLDKKDAALKRARKALEACSDCCHDHCTDSKHSRMAEKALSQLP